MIRIVILSLSALMVAACAQSGGSVPVLLASTPGVVAGAMLTLPQTKKLPTDHLVSWATGRDCSVIHYEQDGQYCMDTPKEVDRQRLYCFKTLGAVECHQRPDPYYNGERVLASPPVRIIEPN